MKWKVSFHSEFLEEFQVFPETVQDNLLAKSLLLEAYGPQLGRPHTDILQGSHYANLKELRLEVKGAQWRVAFAFDPWRTAILLAGGNKTGRNQIRFYKQLIQKADKRFKDHLQLTKKKK
jgi:hypothetical protein